MQFQPASAATSSSPSPADSVKQNAKADVLVAGSVAIDLSCDYASYKKGDVAPQINTSNPASIRQSIGGVGHNVALAAHRASGKAVVRFCSLVGDDLAASTVVSKLEAEGFDTTHIRRLGPEFAPANRTAQYVAVNDGNKNLVMAMADMEIFSQHSFPEHWRSVVQKTQPKWLVVDGNWGESDIKSWVQAGKEQGAKVAFEPVSVEKSERLFAPVGRGGPSSLGVYPQSSVHLATPNTYELQAMYTVAKENGYLDTNEWFSVIDSFGMRGARERFVYMTSRELTDAGVPVQSVQLLPYIPTIITKLGSEGVLFTTILGRDDPRLFDPQSQQFILARTTDHPTIGGIYMRLFPPAEKVDDVVSVNGVGDTFLGVLVSGLAQGGSAEKLIDVAQQGAVMTLKSSESVNPELRRIEGRLEQALAR